MANIQQHISIEKAQLINELNTKSFDEINLRLSKLQPNDSNEVFLGTTIVYPEKTAPFQVKEVIVCQNSFISGYVITDSKNKDFKLTTDALRKEIQANSSDFTNASVDKFNQIQIEDEHTIPYVNQFSDEEIENIKTCARILEVPFLLNCYTYTHNEDDTITVALHEDFGNYVFDIGKNSQPVLPAPLKYIDGKLITDMSNLFNGCQAKSLDLTNFDTSNITDMSHMFEGAQANEINVSSFNTSLVEDMSFMFSSCQTTKLDISKFKTGNVCDMSFMFYSCQVKALDLSNFDTSSVNDISKMFCGCQASTINTKSFDTTNVIDMSRMFKSCQVTTIDLSNFNTSNVENMSSMFSGCLATDIILDSFDTRKVTNMSGMFYSCQAKTLNISNFDTSNVTYNDGMFDNFKNTLIQ